MKIKARLAAFAVVIAVAVSAVSGCSESFGKFDSQEYVNSFPDHVPAELDDLDNLEPYDYSYGRDERGYWKDFRARNYVGKFDYKNIDVPFSVYTVTDNDIDMIIRDILLGSYPVKDMESPVEMYSTVNIDFVGTVDGVEFEGGTTDGKGYKVTIGVTSFIDDFLEQLIGSKPGDVVNVEVTFPDVYPNSPDLEGQDALFVTTINFVYGEEPDSITDEYVQEFFGETLGLTNVADFREFIRKDERERRTEQFFAEYLAENTEFKGNPTKLHDNLVKIMIDYFRNEAANYGLPTFTYYLENMLGIDDGIRGLVRANQSRHETNLLQQFAVQAIAEDADIVVTEEEVREFMMNVNRMDEAEYNDAVANYGLPYLAQLVLQSKVFEYMFSEANLLPA